MAAVSPRCSLRSAASWKPIAPEESISVSDALHAYTMGGALASGDEENRGSLSAGKWADFVLLDRDPASVPVDEIAGIRVVKTFVSGRLVHTA